MNEIEMIENLLKSAERPLLKSEILSEINTLDFPTLNKLLDQLESQGKVVVGGKGVLWTYSESKKFIETLDSAVTFDG